MSFSAAPGELILLTGPTGCGKSTLLRLLAGLLQRHGRGEFSGAIAVSGHDPAALSPAERARHIGFVSQEPRDQLVTGTVGDELAFALESIACPPAEITARLPSLQAMVGLGVPLAHATGALSGGQTQRLVTGAALSAGASLLLLDEPLAQLDPDGARALLERLRALSAQGITVVMVEHRLEAALDVATRLLVMADGALLSDTPAAALRPGSPLLGQLRKLGLTLPGMLDLADRIAPLSPTAARYPLPPPEPPAPSGAVLIDARGLHHRYPDAAQDALTSLDLTLCAGERVAILGGNGAGKSTLLGLLSGRLGAPLAEGVIAVPQDPDLALFCATVSAELAYGPQEAGLRGPALAARVDAAAAALSVSALLTQAPQALSRGQRLRAAVAAALACAPRLLLLDEPTSGQDHDQIEHMMASLRDALAGGALVFATHDVELALRHATRILVLHEGRLLVDAPPQVALADLPAEVPISLPPLAAFCLRAGLPPSTPAALAAVAEPGSTLPPPARRPLPEPDIPAPAPVEAPGRGLDPRTQLGLLSAAGLLAISLERPEALGVFALACVLPLAWMRVGWAWWRRGAVAVLAIVWSTVLSQGLFYAEQPRVSLGHIGPLHLYREGVTYGLAQSMRFVGLSLAGIAVTVSTPPDRMFAALSQLRVPFGLALMAATALRFLPALAEEALTVRRARAARGRPAWRRGPLAWLRLEVSLLRPVVARSWRRAQNLAESLDTRGFDPVSPRQPRRPLVMRPRDWGVLATAAVVSLSVVASRLLYVLYTAETLYVPALRPLYGFVRSFL